MSTNTDRNYENDVIDLQELFKTLWRGKYIIALAMVAFGFLGSYYSNSVAVPMYTSTSVVILDQRESDVANLGDVLGDLGGDTVTLNSEVEVIRSRGLMEKVIEELSLLSDSEFNPSLSLPSQLDMFMNKVKNVLGLEKEVPDLAPYDRREIITAVDILLEKLTVRLMPNTLVIRITVETTSGEKSAEIAQTIAETYVRNQIQVKFRATEDATVWLSNRVTELEAEVERTQAEVKAFRAGTELISTDVLAAREVQLKDLRERLEAKRALAQKEAAKLEALEGIQNPQDFVRILDDTTLEAIYLRLKENPEERDNFYNRAELLISRLEDDLIRTKREAESLKTSAGIVTEQVTRQNEELIKLQQLQRTADTNLVLYEHFLTRLKETSVQQGLHSSDSRVLSRAETPINPTSPKKTLITAIGLILGAIIGAVYVLLRDIGSTVYRTSEELENDAGHQVLGQVPVLPFYDRNKVLTYLNKNRTSPTSEAIRNLRTSIFLSSQTPPQVICLSSSVPGEGKSTLTLALAQNVSQMGKKVLVIEGDMRRRIFEKFSSTTSKRGFASIVNGILSFEDAVTHNPDVGADILHAEPSEVNPADIFASSNFSKLIMQLREKYDFIFIDSPPLLVVPDARIIAKYVDIMLVVVKWDMTNNTMVKESLRELEKVGVDSPGLVLNQINIKKMQRYGYGGRYDGYNSYQDYYNT